MLTRRSSEAHHFGNSLPDDSEFEQYSPASCKILSPRDALYTKKNGYPESRGRQPNEYQEFTHICLYLLIAAL